ncbi:MAG: hypothetical protein OXC72_02860 [Roseovarius sp.]|nr:hypothetical protein [Roseovarius sp.]
MNSSAICPAKKPISALVALMLISSCTNKDEREYFEGNYYPTRAKAASKDNRLSFAVTVKGAGAGPEGALMAGMHAGRLYCISNFGTSGIEWMPVEKDEEGMPVLDGEILVVGGECKLW